MIDLGDVHRITVPVRDPGGTLTSPTAATLTITLPDGSTVTPAVTLPPDVVGMVVVDYPTIQAGRHTFVLTTETPQTAYRDVFDVREAEVASIVSLADAKNQLNITGTGDDEELRGYIEATTAVVEFNAGSTYSREYVETHQTYGPTVPLRHFPVAEVTSISAVHTGGSGIDVADVDVDEFGIMRMLSGGRFCGLYRITYTAGYTTIPANLTRAALIIIQHMWETQRPRDSRRPSIGRADDLAQAQDSAGRFYSIPRRALELLQPNMVGGIA